MPEDAQLRKLNRQIEETMLKLDQAHSVIKTIQMTDSIHRQCIAKYTRIANTLVKYVWEKEKKFPGNEGSTIDQRLTDLFKRYKNSHENAWYERAFNRMSEEAGMRARKKLDEFANALEQALKDRQGSGGVTLKQIRQLEKLRREIEQMTGLRMGHPN